MWERDIYIHTQMGRNWRIDIYIYIYIYIYIMFLKTQVLNGFRSSKWLSPARSACSGAATLILHARSQISPNCGNFSSDFVGRVYKKMWNQSMTFSGYVGVYKYIDMWNKPWFPVRNMIYIHGGSSTSLCLRIGDPRSPVLVVWLRFFHPYRGSSVYPPQNKYGSNFFFEEIWIEEVMSNP